MGTDEKNGGFCSKAKSHLKIRNLLRKLGKLQNFAGPSTKSNREMHMRYRKTLDETAKMTKPMRIVKMTKIPKFLKAIDEKLMGNANEAIEAKNYKKISALTLAVLPTGKWLLPGSEISCCPGKWLFVCHRFTQ